MCADADTRRYCRKCLCHLCPNRLPQDGIAWPAVQAALKGVKNSLKLEVKLLSKESGMMPNDKINIAWKITNSGKNALTEIKR